MRPLSTNRIPLTLLLCGVLSCLSTPALAQLPSGETPSGGQAGLDLGKELDRDEFAFTLRMRAIKVPDFALGSFFERHASNWSEGISNFSYGGEFTWRQRGEFELSFGLDYANLAMPTQFWLENDKDPSEATYTEVDLSLLSFVVAGYWTWDPTFWLSPYVGAGLGAGFVFGGIYESEPVADSACEQGLGEDPNQFAPSECFDDQGNPDPGGITGRARNEDIWAVFPVVHLALGLRFNIVKNGIFKLEVGINDYAYAGAAIGIQWW